MSAGSSARYALAPLASEIWVRASRSASGPMPIVMTGIGRAGSTSVRSVVSRLTRSIPTGVVLVTPVGEQDHRIDLLGVVDRPHCPEGRQGRVVEGGAALGPVGQLIDGGDERLVARNLPDGIGDRADRHELDVIVRRILVHREGCRGIAAYPVNGTNREVGDL